MSGYIRPCKDPHLQKKIHASQGHAPGKPPRVSKKLNIEEKPCCIISTRNGVLQVEEEVAEELAKLEGKVMVVAIVGPYRTGKSYLMNRLAGTSAGFALGATIVSETKGIWIWVRPHPTEKDTHLVLLDTEGLGDPEKGDLNHDNWIFILATLLCSTLIYNVMTTINEEVITKLNFITEMSKRLKVRQGSGEDDSDSSYFPSFIVTVRDFTLEMERNGKEITPDEFLEELLELKPKENAEFNDPRRCIKKYFKDRKCFTFDRPAGKRQLKHLESLDEKYLSEDFLEDTDMFIKYIFSSCKPKTANGIPMNCRMLASLFVSYVQAIKNGDIPCIESAFNIFRREENETASRAAFQCYTEYMVSVEYPTEVEGILLQHHDTAKERALVCLRQNMFEDVDGSVEQNLDNYIEMAYQGFAQENRKISEEKCWESLREYGRFLEARVLLAEYVMAGGYRKHQEDLKQVKEMFMNTAGLGLMKQAVWAEYAEERKNEGKLLQGIDNKITQREKVYRETKLEEDRQRAAMEVEMSKLTTTLSSMTSYLGDMMKSMGTEGPGQFRESLNDMENTIKVHTEKNRKFEQDILEQRQGHEMKEKEFNDRIAAMEKHRLEIVREAKEKDKQYTEILLKLNKKRGSKCVIM